VCLRARDNWSKRRHIALDVANIVKHQKIDGFSVLEDPERFGQDVSGLRCGGDMTNVYFSRVVGHANVVMARVDVFCSRMINVILNILESRFSVGDDCARFMDLSSLRRNAASLVASVRATYSLSMEERATVYFCLRDAQMTAPLL
jgi:hypothetical protein